MRRFLLGITLVLVAAATLPVSAATDDPPLPRDSLYQLTLSLTDQSGARFDWRTLRGTPRVVSMFYTSCQFTCPLTIEAGKAVQRALTPAQQQRLGIVMISIDPKRDTPPVLARTAASHRLDVTHWILAVPKASDVRAAAGALGVRYRQLSNGDFNHTTALVLLDGEGRELARTEQVGSQPDPDFVEAVRRATGR